MGLACRMSTRAMKGVAPSLHPFRAIAPQEFAIHWRHETCAAGEPFGFNGPATHRIGVAGRIQAGVIPWNNSGITSIEQ